MTVWDLADLRLLLPVLAVVLMLQGAGFALGIGLLFPRVPQTAAVYVTTGAVVMNLITAGLIFKPQVVAEQRLKGSYDFLRALPVPRAAATLAWFTIALLVALPAVAVGLLTGAARYGIAFDVKPAVVPAVLAVCLTGVLIGYTLAHGLAPAVAQVVSITMIFVMVGFSPVVFPAGQLPGWLAAVNEWLPFGSMGTLVRGALVDGFAAGAARAWLVVAAWAAAAALATAWTLGHRG
jgi:ABC-2 type transport system permease protein